MTITNLNIFQSGTLASVTPVNENFETLRVAVNTVEQSVTTNRTYLDGKLAEVNSSITAAVKSERGLGSVFCINEGPIDVHGEPKILDISDSALSFITPFIGTTINGDSVSASIVNNVSLSGYEDGTYNVFLDTNADAEVLKNTIYRQSDEPSAHINDIWLDTSSAPLSAKRYTSDGWTDFNKIPVGSFVITSGSASDIKTFPYNQNGYNTNTQSNYPFPDYGKRVSKSNSVTYTTNENGWLYANFNNSGTVTLTKNNVSYVIKGNSGYSQMIPLSKGTTYIAANLSTLYYVPALDF